MEKDFRDLKRSKDALQEDLSRDVNRSLLDY